MTVLHKTDHWIAQNHGVGEEGEPADFIFWAIDRLFMRTGGRCQMPARRKPEDAHPVRVDRPALRVAAHKLYGAAGVEQGDGVAVRGHAVVDHKRGHAQRVKPASDRLRFVLGLHPVPAARANDHGGGWAASMQRVRRQSRRGLLIFGVKTGRRAIPQRHGKGGGIPISHNAPRERVLP